MDTKTFVITKDDDNKDVIEETRTVVSVYDKEQLQKQLELITKTRDKLSLEIERIQSLLDQFPKEVISK